MYIKKINKNKLVQHPAILTSRLVNIIQGCQKDFKYQADDE